MRWILKRNSYGSVTEKMDCQLGDETDSDARDLSVTHGCRFLMLQTGATSLTKYNVKTGRTAMQYIKTANDNVSLGQLIKTIKHTFKFASQHHSVQGKVPSRHGVPSCHTGPQYMFRI